MDTAVGLDPEAALEISAAYEGAREALREDDFLVAEQQFLQVWKHEEAPAATAAWAGFEAAIAALLDGRSGDARRQLALLQIFLGEKKQHDTKLGKRLLSAIGLLSSLSFVPEESVPVVLENPFRATIFFALALKSWEQGQLERARGMFARLGAAGPWPDAEWMDVYGELAGRYVTDHQLVQRADHALTGKDQEQIQAAIEQLDEIYAGLQTRGRARFNVKVWQSDLMKRLRYLKSRRVAPQWEELRREVNLQCAAARFAAAAEMMKAAKLEGQLENDQRAALVAFCEEAVLFLGDLQRALGPGASGVELRNRAGEEFDQILGSQDGGLLVGDRGAARSLDWGEIEPLSLLVLHQNLVNATPDPVQKEARLRQAIAYAWLNDQRPVADGLAEKTAALDPSFQAEWEQLKAWLQD